MHVFQQLFEATSSTFTYVLVDALDRSTVIIDPVDRNLSEITALLRRDRLKLQYILETHNHADHVTSAGALALLTGAQTATPVDCGIASDLRLEDGAELAFGRNEVIRALHTPGHTAGSMSYLWRNKVMTGDALLINGCGRTDFQGGDAGQLYDSITAKLFTLPDATEVYPAHDYRGRTSTTIGAEKAGNVRIAGRSREAFIALMNALNLPPPRLIDHAPAANRRLGLPEHGV